MLRTLFRSAVLSAIIVMFSFYYYSPNHHEPIKYNNHSIPPKMDQHHKAMNKEGNDHTLRPEEGLSVYIGKSADEFIADYGEPNRKDLSAYGYDWWIYNNDVRTYMQVGVAQGRVVTIYAIGDQLNVAPYKMTQTIEDIYRATLLETELVVKSEHGTYQFELSEEDLNIRPLVQHGDIFAQLSIDKYTGTLSSVRFFNQQTLVSQRPYEMIYRGDLLTLENPSEDEWREIEKGSERQIYDITNVIRSRFHLKQLSWNDDVASIAFEHSKDMYENSYFAHESPVYGDLTSRLGAGDIEFQLAGENIATEYIDGPAAVEGWLNSEGHRNTMLDKNYTEIGVGVYEKYYTQNFLKPINE